MMGDLCFIGPLLLSSIRVWTLVFLSFFFFVFFYSVF